MPPPSRDQTAEAAAPGFVSALHFWGDGSADRGKYSILSGGLPPLAPRDFFLSPPPCVWPGQGGPALWPVTREHPSRCGAGGGLWVSRGAGCGPPELINAGLSSAATATAHKTQPGRDESNGSSPASYPPSKLSILRFLPHPMVLIGSHYTPAAQRRTGRAQKPPCAPPQRAPSLSMLAFRLVF